MCSSRSVIFKLRSCCRSIRQISIDWLRMSLTTLLFQSIKADGDVPAGRHAFSGVVNGQSLLVFGGYGRHQTFFDDLYEFHFGNNRSVSSNCVPSNLHLNWSFNRTREMVGNQVFWKVQTRCKVRLKNRGMLREGRHSPSLVLYNHHLLVFGGTGSTGKNYDAIESFSIGSHLEMIALTVQEIEGGKRLWIEVHR